MDVDEYLKNNREKGNLGEDVACLYLKRHGFEIVDRNYYKKWGELDIIAKKDGILHFIEVKSSLSGNLDQYRPEDNVHNIKQKKLRRIIQTYLNEIKYDYSKEFKFHVVTVILNKTTGKYVVKMIKDIIL